jgi:hypothetical protein
MGTFGRLSCPEFRCYTVERPWKGNQPNISCFPVGFYPLVLGVFHKGNYPAYEIQRVPGRSLIKIHIANRAKEVMGCIAPGFELGWVEDSWAVLASTQAYHAFMDAMMGVERTMIRIYNQETGVLERSEGLWEGGRVI